MVAGHLLTPVLRQGDFSCEPALSELSLLYAVRYYANETISHHPLSAQWHEISLGSRSSTLLSQRFVNSPFPKEAPIRGHMAALRHPSAES